MERAFDWMFEHMGTVLIVVIVVIASGFIVAGVQSCQLHNDCDARGGTVEKYNCQTMYVQTGNILVPSETCKERCIGGRP